MSLSKKIINEIYIRINRKAAEGHNIKSVTLGIDLYNHVQNDSSNVFYNHSHNATIFGYPISVSYKRKNLIQINIKRSRIYRFIKKANRYKTMDYMNNFMAYGDGGKSMFSDIIYNFYQNSDKKDCAEINLKYLKYRDLEHSGKNYLTSSPKSV